MQRTDRQLLVMAALAAVNHGLIIQARQILEAFPWLIPDEVLRRLCQAVVLLGLGQPSDALHCLIDLETPEALALRRLITIHYPTVVAETFSHCKSYAIIP